MDNDPTVFHAGYAVAADTPDVDTIYSVDALGMIDKTGVANPMRRRYLVKQAEKDLGRSPVQSIVLQTDSENSTLALASKINDESPKATNGRWT